MATTDQPRDFDLLETRGALRRCRVELAAIALELEADGEDPDNVAELNGIADLLGDLVQNSPILRLPQPAVS